MFILRFTTILAFLSFSVQASPLAYRDVIAPKIILPDSTSVWPVGTQQAVTWDTSNFPAHITNPIGKVILGFNESNSLNLDFDHPLAQGFNLTDGKVMVTVPNVQPRDDYLIVLFGDSGNTSPAFAITRISAGSDNSSSSASSGSVSDSSTAAATSFSITGFATTVAFAESTPTGTDITTAPLPAATSLTGTTTSSTGSASSTASAVTSALHASTPTSAGWSMHFGNSIWSSAAPVLMSVAPLVMLFMV